MASNLVNQWYDEDLFSAEIKLAQRHRDIDGVVEISSRITNAQNQYLEELKTLWTNNESAYTSRNNAWYSWETRKTKCKRTILISIVFYFISWGALEIRVLPTLFALLELLACIIILGSLIGLIVTKLIEGRKWKAYSSYKDSLTSRANKITRKYSSIADSLYEEIDDLYLSTLEPAHKEAVLMRRDQERHHQELLSEQRQHQVRLEAEQAEILKTQQRLLEIEEEKERRRKENSW